MTRFNIYIQRHRETKKRSNTNYLMIENFKSVFLQFFQIIQEHLKVKSFKLPNYLNFFI